MQKKKTCYNKISIKCFKIAFFFFKEPLEGQRLKVLEVYNWETKPPFIKRFLHVGIELY